MDYIVAFATDDGVKMVNKHFGDAGFYSIYKISENESVFIEKRNNVTDESDERFHGDPLKAGKIGKIMNGVQILCSKQFGKNIIQMKKKFLPVLFDVDSIEEAIIILRQNLVQIEEQWLIGSERNHLKFRSS